jgi:hypothetical protein
MYGHEKILLICLWNAEACFCLANSLLLDSIYQGDGVDEGCQSGMGVAVTSTDWIIQPSTRSSLLITNTCTQTTLFTSCKSLGMMVTVEPLPRIFNTIPPGFSRIYAPPPSDALMSAMMGVGSAVIVEVGDLAGDGDTSGVMELGVDVRDGVKVGTPMTAVTGSRVDVDVIVGISDRVEVA